MLLEQFSIIDPLPTQWFLFTAPKKSAKIWIFIVSKGRSNKGTLCSNLLTWMLLSFLSFHSQNVHKNRQNHCAYFIPEKRKIISLSFKKLEGHLRDQKSSNIVKLLPWKSGIFRKVSCLRKYWLINL